MFKKYNEIFERFLRVCKDKYNSPNPNLEDCCITCNRCLWELSGMLKLMESLGEITTEKKDQEFERICNTFQPIDLFNAYMEKGQVMTFTQYKSLTKEKV